MTDDEKKLTQEQRDFINNCKTKSSSALTRLRIEEHASSGYPNMSNFEKVAYVKQYLAKSNNYAINVALNEAGYIFDVDALLKSIEKKLNDENLKSKLPTHVVQPAGSPGYHPTDCIASAKHLLAVEKEITTALKSCPKKPRPEPKPVIGKPKGFETTSKDHQVRVEQWMEHVGLKDDAKALIDKYGLLVAYEIVQTSMQSPADMTKATDGKFKSSKNTIQYFLDNDVPAEKLVMIPDLDAETVDLSLFSVKKPMEVSSKIAPLPEVPTVEIPSVVSTLPSASQLSAADIQKAHYASLMKNSVKLDGIADEEVKAAVDFAFKEAVRCQTDDMEAWTGNFRFNLTKALGLEKIAKDQEEYKKWSKNIITNSDNAVEVSAGGNPDESLTEQIDAYSRVVSNQKLKVDLVSMSAKDTLNADVYFKDRLLQKKLEAREAKKAAKEARKAERAENRKEKNEEIRAFFKGVKSILD